MTVEWDLDGDGAFEVAPTTTKTLNRQLTTPGDFRVTARLTDTAGDSSVSAALMLRVVHESDFDEDGDVDGGDLVAWTAGHGKSGNATHQDGDADGDRDVDGGDYLAWQRQLGSSAATIEAVPEPGASVLGLLAVSIVIASRRRARF
jgi:hypothetical protein